MKLKLMVFISLYYLIFILHGCNFLEKPNSFDLKSPDEKVTGTLFLNEANQLIYNISFNEQVVIENSCMGITVNSVDLGKDVEINRPESIVINQQYKTRGVHTIAKNHCNQWTFPLTHLKSGKKYEIQLRVYDDGFAYRYIVPGNGTQRILGESSSWKIPEHTKVWFFERPNDWKLKSYAGEWLRTDIDSLHKISPTGPLQGMPLVLELPEENGFAVITEAALYNYSGMRLEAKGNRTVTANFHEGESGFLVGDTIVTPWRVTMVVKDLNQLVNSDLIANLNPQPDEVLFRNVDYIQPGRSVWRWWNKGIGTPEEEKQVIDYAYDLGFEYTIIDHGWEEWPDCWNKIKILSSHSKKKNVGVFVWKHSNEIDNPSNDYQEMKEFFDRVKETGAAGIKIDYMNAESKDKVDFEIKALEEAAQRQLLINFHGCHKPTGESRTYPNELTREGIRGLELNSMGEGPIPARHNAALPFTRFVVGHGDYTPLGFTAPGPTTWAHQLATVVIFLSPLQVIAEDSEFLLKDKRVRPALSVIKAIPAVWDETVVLDESRIGELAAFARRSGKNWFVGILNGGNEKTFQLNLEFLNSGDYDATIIEDDLQASKVNLTGLNPKAKLKEFVKAVPFKVSKRNLNRGNKVSLVLAKGGGFVGMFVPHTK